MATGVSNPTTYQNQVEYDHSTLLNRDARDQHPISAITGLEGRLSDITALISGFTSVLEAAKNILNSEYLTNQEATNNFAAKTVETTLATLEASVGDLEAQVNVIQENVNAWHPQTEHQITEQITSLQTTFTEFRDAFVDYKNTHDLAFEAYKSSVDFSTRGIAASLAELSADISKINNQLENLATKNSLEVAITEINEATTNQFSQITTKIDQVEEQIAAVEAAAVLKTTYAADQADNNTKIENMQYHIKDIEEALGYNQSTKTFSTLVETQEIATNAISEVAVLNARLDTKTNIQDMPNTLLVEKIEGDPNKKFAYTITVAKASTADPTVIDNLFSAELDLTSEITEYVNASVQGSDSRLASLQSNLETLIQVVTTLEKYYDFAVLDYHIYFVSNDLDLGYLAPLEKGYVGNCNFDIYPKVDGSSYTDVDLTNKACYIIFTTTRPINLESFSLKVGENNLTNDVTITRIGLPDINRTTYVVSEGTTGNHLTPFTFGTGVLDDLLDQFGTYTFTIEAKAYSQDKEDNAQVRAEATIGIGCPIYYGFSTAATLTGNELSNFDFFIGQSGNKERLIWQSQGGLSGYYYYVVPETLVKDQRLKFKTATGEGGWDELPNKLKYENTTYRVWRTTYALTTLNPTRIEAEII